MPVTWDRTRGATRLLHAFVSKIDAEYWLTVGFAREVEGVAGQVKVAHDGGVGSGGTNSHRVKVCGFDVGR